MSKYTRDHFHAYVREGDGHSTNYKACCTESWMGAITALRRMGFSGPGTAVPDVPEEHWQSKTTNGEYPRAAIQREASNFDDCNPGE